MRNAGKRAKRFADIEKAVERYRKLPTDTIRKTLTCGYQLMPGAEAAYRRVLEERGELTAKKPN